MIFSGASLVPAGRGAVAALAATCYPTRMVMKKLVIAALIQGASASATVLTGDNFDAEVLHPTRSAFVLFYAPWCGTLTASLPRCTPCTASTAPRRRQHRAAPPRRRRRPRLCARILNARLAGAATARR